MSKRIMVVSGPTAVGKSAMAMQLATRWGIPVLSADSRQIFKRLDIGTAKPAREELEKVKHYFVDHVEIDETYSAGKYRDEAGELIGELLKSNDRVLVCGGTGLYIRAITEGFDLIPEVPADIRLQLKDEYENAGLEALNDFLEKADPAYFAVVDRKNPRRLLRAIEVIRTTGKPFSEFLQRRVHVSDPARVLEVHLELPRDELYAKINSRVDTMMASGLLEEAGGLLDYRHCQSMQTVGYAELFGYFDGVMSLDEAVEKIRQHTRNYAKRQMTWFRKYSQGIKIHPGDIGAAIGYFESEVVPW